MTRKCITAYFRSVIIPLIREVVVTALFVVVVRVVDVVELLSPGLFSPPGGTIFAHHSPNVHVHLVIDVVVQR